MQGSWETITLIGAIALDGFRGFMTVDSGTGSEVFSAFVAQQLSPRLNPGDVVVLDNLSAHRNPEAKRVLREAGADLFGGPRHGSDQAARHLRLGEPRWVRSFLGSLFARQPPQKTHEAIELRFNLGNPLAVHIAPRRCSKQCWPMNGEADLPTHGPCGQSGQSMALCLGVPRRLRFRQLTS